MYTKYQIPPKESLRDPTGQANTKYQKGLGLVELVIVVGISAIILFSLSQMVYLSNLVFSRAENAARALRLVEETMEAARIFRDRTGWSVNGLGSLTIGNPYHPEISAGNWNLAVGQETIDGRFVRFLQVDRVYRDANDNIAGSGIEDTNSRKLTVIVRGAGPVKIPEVKLVTYLMNWR